MREPGEGFGPQLAHIPGISFIRKTLVTGISGIPGRKWPGRNASDWKEHQLSPLCAQELSWQGEGIECWVYILYLLVKLY